MIAFPCRVHSLPFRFRATHIRAIPFLPGAVPISIPAIPIQFSSFPTPRFASLFRGRSLLLGASHCHRISGLLRSKASLRHSNSIHFRAIPVLRDSNLLQFYAFLGDSDSGHIVSDPIRFSSLLLDSWQIRVYATHSNPIRLDTFPCRFTARLFVAVHILFASNQIFSDSVLGQFRQ